MPVGIEVPYESKLHTTILEGVRARWQLCKQEAENRYTAWSEAEDKALAFLNLTTKDKEREQQRKDGKPQYVTIDIPYSYAQMLAAHTYESAVFLGRAPVLQFEGRHSLSQDSVYALEAIIDYQLHVGKMLAPLYIWLMDKRKYGAGIIGMYWDKQINQTVKIVEQTPSWAGITLPGAKPKKVRLVQQTVAYEGNCIFNVRPYDFIFDPRVPLSRFQEGEFAGHYNEVGWNVIQKKAELKEYINTDRIKSSQTKYWWRDKGTSQLQVPNSADAGGGGIEGMTATSATPDPWKNLGIVTLCNITIELIPREWGLGPREFPEKWYFVVGNDSVVLQARPLELMHNQYPYAIQEGEIEGYGLFKRSMLEVLEPLNATLTWLFNTHFYNVRRAVNDQLIADPSRVAISDLEDPDKGRIIRLKPTAYGQDIRTVVGQLQVVDITKDHIGRDAAVVMDILQRLAGVSEGIMGILDPAGRKTATEVRQAGGAGLTRLKTEAEYGSAQGWEPFAQMLVQSTQQYYDAVKEFKIAGDLMQRADRLIQVTPESIGGFFDFVPADGTLPIDRYAQAALWKELLQGMAQIPSLLMQFDLGRIFEHVGMLAGVKNVNRFRLHITPDQVLQNQMQMGNVIPLGAGGKGGSATNRGAAGGTTGTPGVAQIPGMGPTL